MTKADWIGFGVLLVVVILYAFTLAMILTDTPFRETPDVVRFMFTREAWGRDDG